MESCDARFLQIDRLGAGVIENPRSCVMIALLCLKKRLHCQVPPRGKVNVELVENQIMCRIQGPGLGLFGIWLQGGPLTPQGNLP